MRALLGPLASAASTPLVVDVVAAGGVKPTVQPDDWMMCATIRVVVDFPFGAGDAMIGMRDGVRRREQHLDHGPRDLARPPSEGCRCMRIAGRRLTSTMPPPVSRDGAGDVGRDESTPATSSRWSAPRASDEGVLGMDVVGAVHAVPPVDRLAVSRR
jgi:hypothetical protein